MRRSILLIASLLACAALAFAAPHFAEPGADAAYHPRVRAPRLAPARPVVWFDHGHHNVHSLDGRYRAFGELLRADGCRVRQVSGAFDAAQLRDAAVLVVVNARGAKPHPEGPAFTARECDAVRDYVRDGGSLLLVADHHPCGEAAAALAARFGVGMSGGWCDDSVNARPASGDPGQLLFTRANGGLAPHAITATTDGGQSISVVETFTGQSLQPPAGATPLLRLAPTAMDRLPRAARSVTRGGTTTTTFETDDRSAAGRVQGLALEYGRGRVVVLGEAAMLSAQADGHGHRFGMNAEPANDNGLFALGVMRWLARAHQATSLSAR